MASALAAALTSAPMTIPNLQVAFGQMYGYDDEFNQCKLVHTLRYGHDNLTHIAIAFLERINDNVSKSNEGQMTTKYAEHLADRWNAFKALLEANTTGNYGSTLCSAKILVPLLFSEQISVPDPEGPRGDGYDTYVSRGSGYEDSLMDWSPTMHTTMSGNDVICVRGPKFF